MVSPFFKHQRLKNYERYNFLLLYEHVKKILEKKYGKDNFFYSLEYFFGGLVYNNCKVINMGKNEYLLSGM